MLKQNLSKRLSQKERRRKKRLRPRQVLKIKRQLQLKCLLPKLLKRLNLLANICSSIVFSNSFAQKKPLLTQYLLDISANCLLSSLTGNRNRSFHTSLVQIQMFLNVYFVIFIKRASQRFLTSL